MLESVNPAWFLFMVLIINSQAQNDDNILNSVFQIADDIKSQYLSQNPDGNLYRFGYAVQENGQFHHETIGSDNITYGCYGYLDPIGQLFITYYLSDGWGYRVVQPGEDVELFYHEHEEAPEGVDPGEYYKEHHGVIVSWNELQFPNACEQASSGLVSVITRPYPPQRISGGRSPDTSRVATLSVPGRAAFTNITSTLITNQIGTRVPVLQGSFDSSRTGFIAAGRVDNSANVAGSGGFGIGVAGLQGAGIRGSGPVLQGGQISSQVSSTSRPIIGEPGTVSRVSSVTQSSRPIGAQGFVRTGTQSPGIETSGIQSSGVQSSGFQSTSQVLQSGVNTAGVRAYGVTGSSDINSALIGGGQISTQISSTSRPIIGGTSTFRSSTSQTIRPAGAGGIVRTGEGGIQSSTGIQSTSQVLQSGLGTGAVRGFGVTGSADINNALIGAGQISSTSRPTLSGTQTFRSSTTQAIRPSGTGSIIRTGGGGIQSTSQVVQTGPTRPTGSGSIVRTGTSGIQTSGIQSTSQVLQSGVGTGAVRGFGATGGSDIGNALIVDGQISSTFRPIVGGTSTFRSSTTQTSSFTPSTPSIVRTGTGGIQSTSQFSQSGINTGQIFSTSRPILSGIQTTRPTGGGGVVSTGTSGIQTSGLRGSGIFNTNQVSQSGVNADANRGFRVTGSSDPNSALIGGGQISTQISSTSRPVLSQTSTVRGIATQTSRPTTVGSVVRTGTFGIQGTNQVSQTEVGAGNIGGAGITGSADINRALLGGGQISSQISSTSIPVISGTSTLRGTVTQNRPPTGTFGVSQIFYTVPGVNTTIIQDKTDRIEGISSGGGFRTVGGPGFSRDERIFRVTDGSGTVRNQGYVFDTSRLQNLTGTAGTVSVSGFNAPGLSAFGDIRNFGGAAVGQNLGRVNNIRTQDSSGIRKLNYFNFQPEFNQSFSGYRTVVSGIPGSRTFVFQNGTRFENVGGGSSAGTGTLDLIRNQVVFSDTPKLNISILQNDGRAFDIRNFDSSRRVTSNLGRNNFTYSTRTTIPGTPQSQYFYIEYPVTSVGRTQTSTRTFDNSLSNGSRVFNIQPFDRKGRPSPINTVGGTGSSVGGTGSGGRSGSGGGTGSGGGGRIGTGGGDGPGRIGGVGSGGGDGPGRVGGVGTGGGDGRGRDGTVGGIGGIGGVGGIGGIGGIGGVGGVGRDGPSGSSTYPTGSPGPNGPWPGDPDYVPPARRPALSPSRRPTISTAFNQNALEGRQSIAIPTIIKQNPESYLVTQGSSINKKLSKDLEEYPSSVVMLIYSNLDDPRLKHPKGAKKVVSDVKENSNRGKSKYRYLPEKTNLDVKISPTPESFTN